MRFVTRTPIRFAALLSMLIMASQVSAGLVGLSVFREGLYGLPDPAPDATRWIYRVYAEFTEPTDYLTSWGIGLSLGPGQIRNIRADGSPGTGFVNIPDDNTGNLAPGNPYHGRDWDTYMTMGLFYGAMGPLGIDSTIIALGTPTFIAGGSTVWTGQVGSVRLPAPYTQGRADFVHNLGNDTDHRVLLMQLAVNAGEYVDGAIGVVWRSQPSGSGSVATGLSFSSIPEPASMAPLLILAMSVRRRR